MGIRKYDKEIQISNKRLQKEAEKELRKIKPRKNRQARKKRRYYRIPRKYEVYIKSDHWIKRKNKYFQKNERVCRACKSCKFICLHHAFYGNYGSERDEHLVPLCKDCHVDFHKRYKTNKNMIKRTKRFIREKSHVL